MTAGLSSMPFYGGFTCLNRKALNWGAPMKRGGGQGRGLDLGAESGVTLADLGLTLGRLLVDFGPTLGRLWPDFGPTLGRLLANLGRLEADF